MTRGRILTAVALGAVALAYAVPMESVGCAQTSHYAATRSIAEGRPDIDRYAQETCDLVRVGGIIGAVARKYTKRGEAYAQFRLEGLAGGVEVVAFPSVYEAVPGLIEVDRIVLVAGRIDLRGRELQIRATEVKEPKLGEAGPAPLSSSLVVDLPIAACTPAVLQRLRDLLDSHPGEAPVHVRVVGSDGSVTPMKVGSARVDAGPTLVADLASLLGGDAARVERSANPSPAVTV